MMFTVPTVVTSNDLNKRSYITFYFKNKRVREYNGNNLNLRLNPNRAGSITERAKVLEELRFQLHKSLEANEYPKLNPTFQITHTPTANPKQRSDLKRHESTATLTVLFKVVKAKIKSELSKKYKRNLKSIYRQFKTFMSDEEKTGSLLSIKVARIELFLSQFGSTGTYYMNKRRDLGVLFSSAGRLIDQSVEVVRITPKRKTKATLHQMYEQEQLKPILSFLKDNYPNLYICCLLTYGSWLRPHEEVRLLTLSNFKNNMSEVHLSGDENKGGKIRVVYIPEYIRLELQPILSNLRRTDNIFSLHTKPFNEYYFNTQWSRAWPQMHALGLIYKDQTIYSFRHTAAVSTYKKTKDVYLLQKLLGHSTILVTLKYLRSLGEFNYEELREAAPKLDL